MSVPDELRRYVPRTDLYDSYELISYHMPVEQPPATASYIIFKKGNKIYAKNGVYGHIEYEDTDSATVIQNALNNLTPNRTWKEKIIIKDDLEIKNTINVPSYTQIEIHGRLKLTDNANLHMIQFGDGGSTSITDVDIIGGTLDGNMANQTQLCHGIYLNANVHHVRIHRVTFENWYGKAVAIFGTATYPNTYVQVANCIMKNFKSGVDADGVDVDQANNVSIIGNIIMNTGDDGIDLGAVSEFVVANNVLYKCHNGIEIYASKGTIVGNSVYNSETFGIVLDRSNWCTCIGNWISFTVQHGIRIVGTKYASIIGNRIWRSSYTNNNTYDDIILEEVGTEYPQYNTIIGNSILEDHPSYKARYGINEESANADYNIIMGNIVVGPATGTIRVQGANTINVNNQA